MENQIDFGENLKNCNSCNTKASAALTLNVRRRRRASRVRRHLLRTASRMSCPMWVGGSEYGDYEYQYYVPGHGEMEEDGEQSVAYKTITVGVCAMKNKVQAPPMQRILERLRERRYIELITFPENVILETPVEEWPVCECLVAFYSKGFPLKKAISYVELRKPLVFNDLQMQYSLMDRREVFKILNANGIETPKYAVVDRVKDKDVKVVVNEADDMLEIDGTVFHKPFVEKPVSAEDHNIYIYFPSDFGGGSQRLFRKVKNRSSCYSGESSIRTQGSYIYEEFLATDGTDVKVYTVGPDYAHAEARKSPALDGKVERDENGKEVRYPVILTAKEKLIARAVCLAFKQTVCGFDLLRANGKSYVCDVNGFSFVKNSHKYYDDCAQILLEMITLNLCPQFFPSVPPSVDYLVDEFPAMPVPIPRVGNNMELRCVVGVIRHGDRTPKQKMKMIVKHKRFFDLFQELHGYETGHVKIKKPKLLQRVLDISRVLLGQHEEDTCGEIEEKKHKLEQLKSVLEMYGTFSGINRKLQFKLLSKKNKSEAPPRLLLILKWGGEQTLSGQNQAEELGRAFRIIYPGGEGEYASLPGSGFLRLHSTYRHDLKVYASDEGRVQMTAAAFTKGLLDLEGNPASVLVHLVKRDQAATNMLDTSTVAQNAMNRVKEHLHEIMRSPGDFDDNSYAELAPAGSELIGRPMELVGNPVNQCEQVYTLIQTLMKQLKTMFEEEGDCDLYHGETLQLMINRWCKLEKDFKQEQGKFDISKIPDIYDCIKYDLLHNRNLNLAVGEDLFKCIMPLADIVMPQEYGITIDEKLDIAHKICKPILSKIQADFHHTIINETTDVLHRLDHRLSKGVISPKRHVRTRLYFTSESHVHSLTNLLKHDKLIELSDEEDGMENLCNVPELNYMTQIVFLLFEDCSQPEDSDLRYCVTIHFSPGVRCRNELLSKATDGLSNPNTPTPSPNKHAPIHTMAYSTKNGASSQLSVNSEDAGELRPKEVHIVRRYSEHMPISQGKLQSNKFSFQPSLSPVWMNKSSRNSAVKSHSETEITFEDKKRKVGVSSTYSQPVYHSNHGGIIDSMVPSTALSDSCGRHHSFDLSPGLEVRKSMPKIVKEAQPKSTVSFTIGGDSNGSNSSQSGKPGSTENLLNSDPPRSSNAGLVLATDLVSSISQLTPVASIPLSRVNDYLTTVTGISLNYDQPVYKSSPDPNRRTPIKSLSNCISSISSQADLECKHSNESHLKDSMEAIQGPNSRRASLEVFKSDTVVEMSPDSVQ